MKRRPGVFLFALFVCLSFPLAASALDNPHESMDACPACHSAIPSLEDAEAREFRLLQGTIDATCKACHADFTCALGLGKVVHPSGIEEWDRVVCDGPKTLPLHEGKITCATCHYHLKPVGADFKMVRKATFYEGNVDLTAFCGDCHEDYY